MEALALTDHGNLFGAIEFYQTAIKHGIKPILGCEIYIAPKSRFEKKGGEGGEGSFHLTLLVKNRAGYFNLLKLVSLAHLEGFYYKPRVDKELLSRYHEGLIALSGCPKGEVAFYLSRGEMKRALEAAREYQRIFDQGRFFIEIQRTGIENQEQINGGLLEVARQLGLRWVATNDCHYLHRQDAKAHEVLLCIQTGKTLQDPDRMRFQTEEFYFKSPEEMMDLFSDLPEALSCSVEIAEQCNLELRFEEKHIPKVSIPSGESPESYLEKLAREGLERRFSTSLKKVPPERRSIYQKRLEEELQIIQSMGFSGYFLIVSDFIRFAKENRIPVGPGRGSVAGSLVAYALQITDLDPIEYDLIFERFLNPGRKSSMPDVDVDFCMDRRNEVLQYVMEKYGKENVAQIITFGKMQARAVIRDVGRVLGMPYAEVDRIAKLIPGAPLNLTLEQALEREPKLKEMVEKDPKVASLFQIAKSLEGLVRHASTHAAGVVISNKPLTEYLPLYRGQDGEVITQYAMKEVEAIGLVKFDFLGLKTLTMIHHAIELIEKNRGVRIDLSEIPLDDPKVYASLATGSSLGLFQLESEGMKNLLIRLKPESFKEIIALIALYRPGPLDSGMIEEFIKRRHGIEPIIYEHPLLEGILKDTYGVIVYQEQVMRIASTLAHFSLEDADNLRRAMAKKDALEMVKQKEKFLEGAKRNRIPLRKAEKIFEQMETFGRYGFNKSHSAAYALLAYQTAYLKTHFPIEFMAALLTSEAQNAEKIMRYLAECREMGMTILPPDINESYRNFTVLGNQIRFGLAAVKNVGDAAIEVILREREERGKFRSLYDFCRRVDLRKVNRRVIESLIKCGAFDFTKVYRSQMLTALEEILHWAQSLQRKKETPQMSIWGSNLDELEERYPEMEEFSQQQLILFEKETIGFYISRHPLSPYQEEIRRITEEDSSTLSSGPNGKEVKLCGLVSQMKEVVTKKGDRMAFINLEDMKGWVEVILFPDLFKTASSYLRGGEPVFVRGTLDLSGDQVKVKAKEIRPLSEVSSENLQILHLKIPMGTLTPSSLKELKEVILAHPGPYQVYLHLINGDRPETVIALSEEYRVSPNSEFQEEVKALFPTPLLSFEA